MTKLKPAKETEDGFFYPKFTNKYYIVRRWDDGDKKQFAHHFPVRDGALPKGFRTKKSAEAYVDEWKMKEHHGAKVVSANKAKNYIVPRRRN